MSSKHLLMPTLLYGTFAVLFMLLSVTQNTVNNTAKYTEKTLILVETPFFYVRQRFSSLLEHWLTCKDQPDPLRRLYHVQSTTKLNFCFIYFFQCK